MKVKNFISTILKTMNPKYYRELSDRRVPWRFFALVLIFAFISMFLITIPKLMFIRSDLDEQILDVSKFSIDMSFQTLQPIYIPEKNPVMVLDTTGNASIDRGILITDKNIFYSAFGKDFEIDLSTFNLTSNRQESKQYLLIIFFMFLPSLFFYYYIIYLVKYILIILLLSLVGFFIARIGKHTLDYKQVATLSLYTATPMILIEVLSIPFFFKKYLFTYSPFYGVHFSLIAIVIYLTLFVTAIRISGNPELD